MNKRTLFILGLVIVVLPGFIGLLSGCGSDTSTSPPTEAEQHVADYIGSKECRACHEDIYNTWKKTVHALIVRDVGEPGLTGQSIVADHDGDGENDFSEEFDLVNTKAFSNFGANAPELSSSSPHTVSIGGVDYTVNKTLGGNGGRQLYLTKIGGDTFILPIQYNPLSDTWVQYRAQDWYDGTTPRYSSSPSWEDVKDEGKQHRAFEAVKQGFISTGMTISYSSSSGYDVSQADLNVGCESCHGPGAGHKRNRNDDVPFEESEILNPADMSSLQKQDKVCGRCHARGAGPELAGHELGYPAREIEGGFVTLEPEDLSSSDTFGELFSITSDPSEYLAFGSVPPAPRASKYLNHLNADPLNNAWLAATSNRQQYTNLLNGPHAPDKPYDHPCFDCHNPHKNAQAGGNEDQIITSRNEEGVLIEGIDQDENTLCLACHAGHGDFSAVSALDVKHEAAWGPGSVNIIKESVKDHMNKQARMDAGYEPASDTATGRCTSCHTPAVAHSGGETADAAGYNKGDISNHTFEPIYPNVSVLEASDPTNSCNRCHAGANNDPEIEGDTVIADWSMSGHADYKHGGDHNPFKYPVLNTAPWAQHSKDPCKKCHSGEDHITFVEDFVNDNSIAAGDLAGEWSTYAGEHASNPSVLKCKTCHLPESMGGDTASVRSVDSPVRTVLSEYDTPISRIQAIPEAGGSDLCMSCHSGRESGASISLAQANNEGFPNSHYLAAGGVLYRTAGYEFVDEGRAESDYDNVGFFEHDKIGVSGHGYDTEPVPGSNGPCVSCHMTNDESHGYMPVKKNDTGTITELIADTDATTPPNPGPWGPGTPQCLSCHDGEFGGMDTGTLNHQKEGFEAALDALDTKLANAGIEYLGSYPYFDEDWSDTGNLGAAFNFNFLLHEPGAYAHNRFYTRWLIFDSIDYVEDGQIDGVIHMDTFPRAAEWYEDSSPDTVARSFPPFP